MNLIKPERLGIILTIIIYIGILWSQLVSKSDLFHRHHLRIFPSNHQLVCCSEFPFINTRYHCRFRWWQGDKFKHFTILPFSNNIRTFRMNDKITSESVYTYYSPQSLEANLNPSFFFFLLSFFFFPKTFCGNQKFCVF